MAIAVINQILYDILHKTPNEYSTAESIIFSNDKNWRKHRLLLLGIAEIGEGWLQSKVRKMKDNAKKGIQFCIKEFEDNREAVDEAIGNEIK